MNRIDRLKRSLYKDILLTIFIVIVSIPIWLSFDVSELEEAKKYDNYNFINYEVLNNPKYELVSVSDDYAIRNIETQDLIVYNNTNADASYTLVLKIGKNSRVNLNSIKLNVNHNVDYLNNYNFYEDNEFYYYVIDSDSIQGSSQIYALSMWNDENNKQDNGNKLDYEFVIF